MFADNPRLSGSQLVQAREICAEAVAMVKDRDLAVAAGELDPKFALPDANWSYDASLVIRCVS